MGKYVEECTVYKYKERELYIGFFGGRIDAIKVGDNCIVKPTDDIVKGLAIAFNDCYDPTRGYDDEELLKEACKDDFEEVKCENCPDRYECDICYG